MRAIEVTRHGGPEVLELRTLPVPSPGENEVLVRVHASGVNRPDVSQRIGIYPPPPGASNILGLEIAGEVVRCGPGTLRWKVGDAVCALVVAGGYAEYCVAPAGQCMPLPRGFGYLEAAALPETFFTAWVNLLEPDLGRLQQGDNLLIQGGTSGVGIAATQIARHMRDACVVATASTSEKRSVCLSLGAHAAIDYRDRQWPEQARKAVAGEGFDAILDSQAGPYIAAEQGLLREGGRLVMIGTHLGTHAEVDLRDLMRRRLTLTGSTLRRRPVAFKSRIAAALEAEVWPLLADGRVRMLMHKVFPFEEARFAHMLLDRGEQIGKVVLAVRPA